MLLTNSGPKVFFLFDKESLMLSSAVLFGWDIQSMDITKNKICSQLPNPRSDAV